MTPDENGTRLPGDIQFMEIFNRSISEVFQTVCGFEGDKLLISATNYAAIFIEETKKQPAKTYFLNRNKHFNL
jgi:hypothetical protein